MHTAHIPLIPLPHSPSFPYLSSPSHPSPLDLSESTFDRRSSFSVQFAKASLTLPSHSNRPRVR